VDVELVPLEKLTTHPENPRRGDVAAIAEGMSAYGQYQNIVAQRSTGYVLVGNHRYLAARRLGWENMAVAWLDVDDVTARKVMLWDNRSSDRSAYDEDALAELLASLNDDYAGTGYDPDDVDDLLAGLEQMPVLPQLPTEASYGETPEQTEARRDYFADAKPRQAFGVREAILILPQEEFEQLHACIRQVREAAGGELNAGQAVLLAMRAAVRLIASCDGADGCAWCD